MTTDLPSLSEDNTKRLLKEKNNSIKAGKLIKKFYEVLLENHESPLNQTVLESLNVFVVRLVFLLYADSSELFDSIKFLKYLDQYRTNPDIFRTQLERLFSVLDTPLSKRPPDLEEALTNFPYVTTGLFQNYGVEIPQISEEAIDFLYNELETGFDWRELSPTLFGAVFETTLDPKTRHLGGLHYTSIENIHKVIDPLFLDDLKQELAEIQRYKDNSDSKVKTINDYVEKLASIKFLDPASGSGNFLTETYLSLRRLEDEALELLKNGKVKLNFNGGNLIRVKIDQLYGIEIDAFAVAVASSALLIAQHQALKETERILGKPVGSPAVKTFENIHNANALRIDWNEVLPAQDCDYVIGNPPFLGARLMDPEQKSDLNSVFGPKWKNRGNLDYVSCWYKLANDYIGGFKTKAAFVSTNSIVQGSSVSDLWEPLFERNLHFDFAYTSFKWDNEAKSNAGVYCVILGFSQTKSQKTKRIYTGNSFKEVGNINGYLIDADNVFIKNRFYSIRNLPPIGIGNKPIDGGLYLFSEDEMNAFIALEPLSKEYFKPWYGSREFVNREPRYCLWLGDCSQEELNKMPLALERVERVQEYRQNSKSEITRNLARTPTRFHVENMPESQYLLIPRVTTSERDYVPIGFMDPEEFASDSTIIVRNAGLYHFGILTSKLHMIWLRTVGGRLGEGLRYSKGIVYNNFPWPNPTKTQREAIEATAQGILDARDLYPTRTFADLYDPLLMPPELLEAHLQNDKAVMAAYGWDYAGLSDTDCIEKLMKLYQKQLAESERPS